MARDMKGLYQKVISGSYPDIPSIYSDDLKSVIRMCLEVNPSIRPTSAQLLWKREVVLRLWRFDSGEALKDNLSLLETIWCPIKLS